MRRILETNPESTSALVARLFLAVVVFPHGAQKMLGWFGGNGFPGSINFLTQGAGLPWIIGFLVIIIEFFAPLFLVPGFLTRVAAFAIGVEFTGVVLKAHINNGFFMNWYKQPNKGEGLEFFILLFGLVIIALILGGGKASIDAAISQRTKD
ncbi:MAG TPA: DoxX family protein [Flavisolibacter sp.]|jgi:putative oxidoreductase|nr:DoxX family protein [Flavisolibacter sp.]